MASSGLIAMTDWIWDRVLIPFVTRVPGRVVAAAALLFYPGIGLVLPLLLGWPSRSMTTLDRS